MFFSKNVKLLRKRRRLTQEDLSFSLNLKRSTLCGYENEVASPGIESLIAFSDYFKISIDTMVKIDLTKLSERQMGEIERGYDVYVRGTQIRVLTTTVDRRNRENIELVPEKAKAGYASSYADPEYIRELPVFHLPFLSEQKKYRTFQISGDSMLPIPHKAWITGEFIQDWNLLEPGQPYIILTVDEGIVFKMIKDKITESKILSLYSLNPEYKPYEVNVNDIREIWKFVHYISSEIPPAQLSRDEVLATIAQMKNDMNRIKQRLDEKE